MEKHSESHWATGDELSVLSITEVMRELIGEVNHLAIGQFASLYKLVPHDKTYAKTEQER